MPMYFEHIVMALIMRVLKVRNSMHLNMNGLSIKEKIKLKKILRKISY